MKVTALRPMLWTEDLDGTTGSYLNILGFTRVEMNYDRGWTNLQFGQEIEAI